MRLPEGAAPAPALTLTVGGAAAACGSGRRSTRVCLAVAVVLSDAPQVSTSCNKLAYYEDLVAHIRGLRGANAVIIFNWGAGASSVQAMTAPCLWRPDTSPPLVHTYCLRPPSRPEHKKTF